MDKTTLFYAIVGLILLFALVYGIAKNRLSVTLSYVVLGTMVVIIVFPLFVTVMAAFNDANSLYTSSLIPERFAGLGNFKRLFSETKYLYWYRNTFLVSLSVMTLSTIFITVFAFVLSRFRYKGREVSLSMLLLIQVIPSGSALVALYSIAEAIGIYGSDNSLLNTYLYLIIIYSTGAIPMNTILLKGYFDSIPKDLDESAKIDGASTFKIFREILIPLVMPMVATVALFSFLGPIADVIMPKLLIAEGTSEANTLALGLNSFIANPTEQSYNLFAAGSILVAIPTMVMFFILQKYVVSGLASGGVKG